MTKPITATALQSLKTEAKSIQTASGTSPGEKIAALLGEKVLAQANWLLSSPVAPPVSTPLVVTTRIQMSLTDNEQNIILDFEVLSDPPGGDPTGQMVLPLT